MMYLHNEFKYLKVVADCEIAPFILYKYWRNPYSKKIELLNSSDDITKEINLGIFKNFSL